MQKKYKSTVSLIPARSGSLGLKDKNIFKINGKPLLYYTIKSALNAKQIDNNYVFTDSNKYLKICQKMGLEFPFKRSKKNAQSKSSDSDLIHEFLLKFYKYFQYYPEIVVYLRPTQPLRTSELIDNCLLKFKKNNRGHTCIRTVRETSYPPFWTKKVVKNRIYSLEKNFEKLSRNRRQDLPKSYICDGYIDAFYTRSFLKEGKFPTDKQLPFFNNDIPFVDIDTISDINLFRYYLNK